MGIVIRQSIKSSIVSYIGVLVGAVNLLFIFPKYLDPAEIGLLRVLVDASLVIASLSQFGTINITERFFPYFNDENKKHSGFFLLILAIPFLGFITIAGIFLLFKDIWIETYQAKSALFNNYYYFILPLAFFIMYQQVLEAYCRVHLRIVLPAFVKELFLRIFLTVAVLLMYYGVINIDQLVYALELSYLLAVVILVVYIWKLRRLFCDISLWTNGLLRKDIMIYGGVIFATSLAGVIASKIDVIILSAHDGLVFTGVYAIAFFIGTVIDIPRRSVAMITIPLVSQAWKDNDFKSMGDLYKKSALNMFAVGCLMFLLMWTDLDFVFSWMPNAETFRSGKLVILLIASCRLLEMLTGINGEIILNSPYYRFNLYISAFTSVTTIVANYFLIVNFGMNGAAMAVLLSFVVFNAFKLGFIWKKLDLHPFSFGIIKIALISALVYAVVYGYDLVFPYTSGLFETAGRVIVILLLYGSAIIYFKVSEDITQMFNKVVAGIRKR